MLACQQRPQICSPARLRIDGCDPGPQPLGRLRDADFLQGAEQVRRLVPDGVFIFVVAPSDQELERRQEQRGSETPQDLDSRRKIAVKEMEYATHYQHVVTNDDIDRAVKEILAIIHKARERQT